MGLGCQPNAQPPTWRTRVSLFVQILMLDLSSLGHITSGYATAGVALNIIGSHKPLHHGKVETPSGGGGGEEGQRTLIGEIHEHVYTHVHI
jgi:hypothetical protein